MSIFERPLKTAFTVYPNPCCNEVCYKGTVLCMDFFADKLGNEDEEKVSVVADLESIVTFFCKSRQETYTSDNGWLDILQPLISLNLGKSELYNCFYSILNKYVPRYVK